MNKSNILESKIGMKLSRIGRMERIVVTQKFAKENFSITPEQFTVLTAILDHDGLYQRQIGALTLKDRPNITRIIHILEASGLVTKTPDVNKRKIYKINITEQGKKVHAQIVPAVLKHWQDTLNGVTDEELKSCINVLNKIKVNLEDILDMQI